MKSSLCLEKMISQGWGLIRTARGDKKVTEPSYAHNFHNLMVSDLLLSLFLQNELSKTCMIMITTQTFNYVHKKCIIFQKVLRKILLLALLRNFSQGHKQKVQGRCAPCAPHIPTPVSYHILKVLSQCYSTLLARAYIDVVCIWAERRELTTTAFVSN